MINVKEEKEDLIIDGTPQASSLLIVEDVMSQERTRNLVSRFWQLTSSQKKEIMKKLCLIETAEMRLPEAERYGKAWKRAGERQLIDELATEIEQRETKK